METTRPEHAEESEAPAQPTENPTGDIQLDMLVRLILAVEDLKTLTRLSLGYTVELVRLSNPPVTMLKRIETVLAFLNKRTDSE